MTARDNVVFFAPIANGTAADTVIPLSLLYGVENVRSGYGAAKLKNVRAFFDGAFGNGIGIQIEIKNSNWIDSAGLVAQYIDDDTALFRSSLGFMRGRDKDLAPNTSWIINATLPSAASSAGNVYVILEIEYADVPGVETEGFKGSPIMKVCTNNSVTGAANTAIPLGSFDNLLTDTKYVLSEASVIIPGGSVSQAVNLLVVEGFSNQRGLIRVIPVKNTGAADQIAGSVYLTKQTYNLSIIRSVAMSAHKVSVNLEMVASKN